MDVAGQDTIDPAGGTLVERRDCRPASPGIGPAGPTETGQTAPSDEDYPDVRSGFGEMEGHDAGFAVGPAAAAADDYADADHVDVADGLIQAAAGCDARFAGGPAQPWAQDMDDHPVGEPAGLARAYPVLPAGPDLGEPAGAGLTEPAEAHPSEGNGSPPDVRQSATGPSVRATSADLGHPGPDSRPNMSIAAELAGWAAGELPGQASARLAEWAAMGRVARRDSKPADGPGVGAAGVGSR
ncbi:MAG TPA: hypothetical protein VIV12_12200 [Streptosporangiaceae bacterium]